MDGAVSSQSFWLRGTAMDDFAALVKIVSGIGASFSTKLVKEVA